MKVLITGGTGLIGRAIVEQLLHNNHEVVVYNRNTKRLPFANGVRQITGDKFNHLEFERSMQKESIDVAIDMLCFNKDDVISTVRAFKGNVKQIIITSSVAAYRRPYNSLPVVEDEEELSTNSVFKYAYNKAEIERYLQKVIKEEKLPITIVRPSLTYGPGAVNVGVLRQNYGIVDRIKKGKPLVMFGDGTTPWSFTFAPDLAKGFVGLVGKEKAYGEAYHITSEENHIWEDLYKEIGAILGKKPDIVHMPSEVLYKAAPDLCDHLYFEKCYASLFDNSKIRKVLPGYRASITLNEGLQNLIERNLHFFG